MISGHNFDGLVLLVQIKCCYDLSVNIKVWKKYFKPLADKNKSGILLRLFFANLPFNFTIK